MDEHASPATGFVTRWRRGQVGLPSLLLLFAAMTAVVLGGASVGGWGAIAIVAVAMVAFLALLFGWLAT